MSFEWQTILTVSSLIAALIALYGYFAKVVRFMDKQKKQDTEIEAIKKELSILTVGVLACLKGQKEMGCDGPVTEAISVIEQHLIEQSHR